MPKLTYETLPGAAPARRAWVEAAELRAACAAVRENGGLLHALWGTDERDRSGGFLLRVALQDAEGLLILEHALDGGATSGYPNLAEIFPAAGRMQRAAFDLLGLCAYGGDTRDWLRHAAWPLDHYPLRRDAPRETGPVKDEHYPFVAVAGEGVHEIAVGPVHAGTIEPGHFRFSVVGEKVLRLEERLGYVHKGIEKRFEALPLMEGHRLASRVSGDSAVAFSWAYCMALEAITGAAPPARALWLRALLLERERLANHLGDLGALGNDAGFTVGLAHFSRLKEDLLRMNARAFGARYSMDAVVPGGVASDLAEDQRRALLEALPPLEKEVLALRDIYDDHAGLQDRFLGAGRVAPALARDLGLIGLAGRASGQSWDLRADHPTAPYDRLDLRQCGALAGDVAARVDVRFDELLESLRLCRRLLEDLPAGGTRVEPPPAPAGRLGVGWIEGWRGPVLVMLESGEGETVRRCHPHDPSWQNWPVLEHAVLGNIVPDFPLINKSFNLSYSGQDL
ncbi:MAG: NADH-quinone oxidoreductase subunit C [Bacillota bacterium]